MYIEKKENKENNDRDEKLALDIAQPIQASLNETNELLKKLIIKISEDRDERNNKPQTPNNNTTK